jgi:poly(A) polymerase/tRNA nucleotidyltransferase (CCA-adding enzyme)
VQQSGHHITDVWQHSIDSLNFCPSTDPVVKLACLIHDLGKVKTQKKVNGDYTFYAHEIVGASLAYRIGKRLKLSKKDCIRLSTLVRYHMFHYQKFQTDSAIRRFIKNVRIENLNDIFAVREADRLGSNSKISSWRLEEMKQRIQSQLHQPMSLKDLKINGGDLIKDLGLKPSPMIGKVLNKLMEMVLDDEKLNEKDILLEKAKEINI